MSRAGVTAAEQSTRRCVADGAARYAGCFVAVAGTVPAAPAEAAQAALRAQLRRRRRESARHEAWRTLLARDQQPSANGRAQPVGDTSSVDDVATDSVCLTRGASAGESVLRPALQYRHGRQAT